MNKHDLVLGDEDMNGNITGYDEQRFVVTGTDTGRGFLIQKSIVTGAVVTFPVGSSTVNYSPAQILNNGIKNNFYARVFDSVYEHAVSGSLVKDSSLALTWQIRKQFFGDQEVIITLQNDKKVEDPVFASLRQNSYVTLYGNSKWDKPANFSKASLTGSISTSFPIQTAIMNSRKLYLNNNGIFLSKRVANRSKSFEIPNAFSPNGDNINDTWNIKGLKDFENCHVEIYNRYGRLVFRSFGYQKQWDGKFNNSPMPVGVYYYIIDLRNGEKPLTGYITLLR